MAEAGRAKWDWIGLAAALVLGLASLPLPFGRDQGLYFYVAREWALHGSIPYRDVFDHKPPGVYLLYRLAIHLFGEVQWGIRVLDFIAVVAAGLVVARLATARGVDVARRTRATSILLVAILFYGFLNYWDSAQSEIYYAVLGFAAVASALHVTRVERAAGLAGLLSGAAFVVKPPVVWLAALAALALVLRARSERAYVRTAVPFAAGVALPVALTLAYFAAHRAVGAMLDVVVGANGYYVAHEHDAHPVLSALDSFQAYSVHYTPFFSLLVLGGGLVPWLDARAARPRFLWAWALTLASFAAVVMQLKFYLLHWTPMVLALALLGTLLVQRAESAASGLVGVSSLVLLALWLGAGAGRRWVEQQMATVRYLSGRDSRERFTERFQSLELNFSYAESEWVGVWLRDHTTPADFVAVRGFEPEVYAVAGRRHSGRFFWTTFLTVPARAYRREDYLAEDLRAFRGARRPRFVVARRERSATPGADSVAYFEPLGYRVVVEHGRFVILEGDASGAAQ